jgi:hypothetical protein
MSPTDWRLSTIFERTIDKACPIAETSDVLITGLDEMAAGALDTELWQVDGDTARFDVQAGALSCGPLHSRHANLRTDCLPIDGGQHWVHEGAFEYRASP